MPQIVVVTGAAGAAGRVICAELMKEGFHAVGLDLAETPPAGIAMEGFFGGVDLTNGAAVSDAFDGIAKEHGQVSGLANIAGGFVWETVMEGSLETWDKLWHMNVLTCLNATKSALKHFSGEGGAIVNISAAATAKAATGMAPYTATKSAVSRLTESLADELKPRNIRVNAVLPTVLDTPANRKDMPDADFATWVSPVELASLVTFLISSKGSGINGALVPIAGRL